VCRRVHRAARRAHDSFPRCRERTRSRQHECGRARHEPSGQALPQQRERAHELRAHRAGRPPEPRRDLVCGEARTEVQVEHLGVGRGQLAPQARDLGFQLARGRRLHRIDGGGRRRRPRRRPRAPLVQLARVVAEDPQQPRQGAPARVVARAPLDHRQERALQQVLGVRTVAGEPRRHAQQLRRGPVEQAAEHRRIPRAAEAPQQAVGPIEVERHACVSSGEGTRALHANRDSGRASALLRPNAAGPPTGIDMASVECRWLGHHRGEMSRSRDPRRRHRRWRCSMDERAHTQQGCHGFVDDRGEHPRGVLRTSVQARGHLGADRGFAAPDRADHLAEHVAPRDRVDQELALVAFRAVDRAEVARPCRSRVHRRTHRAPCTCRC